MDYQIIFPHLEITLSHVGKNIMIGSFSIAYYGIVIACGMLAGIAMACHVAKKSGQDPETYSDMALIAIVAAVVGARLYYVAFRWEFYRDNLLSIFNLRAGGLAIYGGVIGGVLSVYIYAKAKKLYFPQLCDTACTGLILGQIIGRWGNFFNREAFGGYTDGLFAMMLPVSAVRSSDCTEELLAHTVVENGVTFIQVHPTFLYESLWNLCLLIFLLCYFKHRKFKGEVMLFYLLGYGLGRFWIESLRTDSLLIFGYPVSKALAGILVLVSAAWILLERMKLRKKQTTDRQPKMQAENKN